MQLQQQYDDLVGDLAAQRNSQPYWPQRSRHSILPLSSEQQLHQPEQAGQDSDTLPPQRLGSIGHPSDAQNSPSAVTSPPSMQVLSVQPLPGKDVMQSAPTSDRLPALPEDPFGQSTPNLTKSAAPSQRNHPLPADLFCQDSPITAQSALSPSDQQVAMPPTQPLAVPLLLNDFDIGRASALSSGGPLSAQHATTPPQGRQGPLRLDTQVSCTSAALPMQPSQHSIDSSFGNRQHGVQPMDTARHNSAKATSSAPRQAGSSPLSAAAAEGSLRSAVSITADAHQPLPSGQQLMGREANLRASLVEWLADAVASRLAIAFQGTPAAGACTKSAAAQQGKAGQAISSTTMSGTYRMSMTKSFVA